MLPLFLVLHSPPSLDSVVFMNRYKDKLEYEFYITDGWKKRKKE
jgi:hypothetical protein